MNDTRTLVVEAYRTSSGREPFTEWLDSIRDPRTQNIIEKRIDRVEDGNMGDYKQLKGPNLPNLYELRFTRGPGYRIYFGVYSCCESDSKTILLLCGGDKSSQTRDIARAKRYSLDIAERDKEYKDARI